ncbi:oxidoreductase [Streptosporangium violaceochromogenes]|nr:oxidoreductase [Streptosporangium violaceochromogenes]
MGRVMTWGVGVGKVLSGPEAVKAAVEAEALGFDEVWVSNERMHRDMFATLGAAAVLTERVRLGTFVSDPFSMHPVITAAAVATVDRLSGGRALFGLGAGGSGFRNLGITAGKPLASVTAALDAVRRLFAGETVTVSAPAFTIEQATLAERPIGRVPVVLASQSPRMLRMGGRDADAVMISTFADPGLFRGATRWAAEGAEDAGRRLDVAKDVIARIDVALHDDVAVARDALRPLIGYLLVLLYPQWGFLGELGVSMPEEVTQACAAKDYAAMAERGKLIPDALIDAFGWAGDPETVTRRVRALAGLGVRRFVILPHAAGGDVLPTVRRFADEVIPAVESASR